MSNSSNPGISLLFIFWLRAYFPTRPESFFSSILFSSLPSFLSVLILKFFWVFSLFIFSLFSWCIIVLVLSGENVWKALGWLLFALWVFLLAGLNILFWACFCLDIEEEVIDNTDELFVILLLLLLLGLAWWAVFIAFESFFLLVFCFDNLGMDFLFIYLLIE